MSEIKEIIEELKNIHDGNAWHGASLKDAPDVTSSPKRGAGIMRVLS